MKSLLLLGVLVLSATMVAQQPSSTGSQPAAAQPSPHMPHAKTKAEFKDFGAASSTSGGAAMEAAADQFAAKYPDSELRAQLYLRAMHEYETENQGPKILAMAEKVLTLNPNDPVALVMTAMILSDQLTLSDPDAPKKAQESKDNASKSLEAIDTNFIPPHGATPEQVQAYKEQLKSMAHSAIGVTDYKLGDYAGAETELKAAAELNKAHPDPYTWYQLTLTQENLKKYPEALASANTGLHYAASNPELTKQFQDERDKLTKLAGGSPPAK